MSDNWFNLIETQLVATLNSDTWLGTSGTTIKTREAKLRPNARAYYDHELPAIAVKVIGFSEQEFSFSILSKFYKFILLILDRGGDLDAVVNTVQQIASVTEDLLEAQIDTTNNLQGLGTHADLLAPPVVKIGGSIIDYKANTENTYTVLCTLEGSVELVME